MLARPREYGKPRTIIAEACTGAGEAMQWDAAEENQRLREDSARRATRPLISVHRWRDDWMGTFTGGVLTS